MKYYALILFALLLCAVIVGIQVFLFGNEKGVIISSLLGIVVGIVIMVIVLRKRIWKKKGLE